MALPGISGFSTFPDWTFCRRRLGNVLDSSTRVLFSWTGHIEVTLKLMEIELWEFLGWVSSSAENFTKENLIWPINLGKQKDHEEDTKSYTRGQDQPVEVEPKSIPQPSRWDNCLTDGHHLISYIFVCVSVARDSDLGLNSIWWLMSVLRTISILARISLNFFPQRCMYPSVGPHGAQSFHRGPSSGGCISLEFCPRQSDVPRIERPPRISPSPRA